MPIYEAAQQLYEVARKRIDELLQRDQNSQAIIKELYRRINSQHLHIIELEKQLEHLAPGLVNEVRESLESEDERFREHWERHTSE